MLRRICNNPACGKVIDGEPPIKKEDPDAALLVRGEPVLWYEDLCPECIERWRACSPTSRGRGRRRCRPSSPGCLQSA